MKKIIILSAASMMLYALSQVCGCGSCSANAQTASKESVKGEPQTVTLKVTGMTCAGCANHISVSLGKLDGVLEHEVKYPGDIATIKYNPERTSEKDIIAAIEKSGKYKAEVVTENSGQGKEKAIKKTKGCAPGCEKSCCAKK